MLVIRKEQMEIFKREAMRQFEKEMALHIKQYFLGMDVAFQEDILLTYIRYIISRAKSYGLSSERDLCKYLNLSMICGRDFDNNPHLSWMTKILSNSGITNPSDRIEKLYKEVLHRLEHQESGRRL